MNGNVINWSFHAYASQRTHLKGISSMILSSVYVEKTCPRFKGHSPTPSYLGQAILFPILIKLYMTIKRCQARLESSCVTWPGHQISVKTLD